MRHRCTVWEEWYFTIPFEDLEENLVWKSEYWSVVVFIDRSYIRLTFFLPLDEECLLGLNQGVKIFDGTTHCTEFLSVIERVIAVVG